MSTATGPLKIPGLLLDFLGRASIAFGCSRSRDRVPQIHWVSGWSVDPDGSTLHCFIPGQFCAGLDEALKDNGQFALTLERIGPHETYQFKGSADSLRPVSAADRAAAAVCRDRFVRDVLAVLPRFQDPALRFPDYSPEPEVSISLRVREIFLQTPGPGAGRRLVPAEAGA